MGWLGHSVGMVAIASGKSSSTLAQSSPLWHWVLHLGGVGLFLVAILDSSVIPLPLPGSTDLLLLILASQGGTTVLLNVLLVLAAFVGSMIGGYMCWSAGRKGGEVALEHYIPKRILKRITSWVERHGAVSVAVSALLPPPVPLTPILLAAGALKIERRPFLLSYGLARALRYGFLGWLGFKYGRRIVAAWVADLNGWSSIILWSYLGLLLAGILFAVIKARKGPAPRSCP
jgi:membrane protein DedA with SNARE-associated domain